MNQHYTVVRVTKSDGTEQLAEFTPHQISVAIERATDNHARAKENINNSFVSRIFIGEWNN